MKKRYWLGVLVIIILGGIGGKMYMDKRQEDRQELLEIQKDLANYVYNNYRLYKKDPKKQEEIVEEYQKDGGITTEEYLERMLSIREYTDIEKIEFTGYTVSPMNFLEVHFNLNNSNKHIATLGVKSAETNKWRYNVDIGRKKTEDKYFIEVREVPNEIEIPTEIIEYYYGGV
ncbi:MULTISPECIES: hypothetical protein [Enterococcus]|uniref:hypothetical protein n=1 Tax=Enterococcus TaxID=1350 RepID=UPI00030D1826|nr:hypothetical protein [Enterococcus mundtii]PTO39750.1 hypothetical protein C6P52_03325 [Enterococcus mundtii]PTO44613.1 hypothetical protein C6P54_04020 [Enterococcus mundtii]